MATTTSQPNPNPQTINLSKIECIPPKNTIATINQFILNTTDFINRFAFFSEEKLLYLDENIEKLETLLILLEKKLETIPAEYFANINTQVSQIPTTPAPLVNNNNNVSTISTPPPPPNITNTQNAGALPPPPPPPPLNLLLAGKITTPPPPLPLNNANNNADAGAAGQQGGTTTTPVVGVEGEEVKQEEKKNEFPGKIFFSFYSRNFFLKRNIKSTKNIMI